MGARADDLTVIDNDDLVGLSGIRNPLCNNNDGCITRYLSQRCVDFGVGVHVKCGERVVEHIDGRTSDDRSGYRQPLALYLAAALMIWAQARLLNLTVQKTMVRLRTDVEDKVHRLPLSYFDGQQRGELLSRVTNDIDNLQSSLSMTISQLVTSILTMVAVLAMMVSISGLLALITLLTVPLSLLVTRAITRRSQPLFVAHWTSTGRLNAHLEETYSGFTVVKTFGHQAAARERFHELNDDV